MTGLNMLSRMVAELLAKIFGEDDAMEWSKIIFDFVLCIPLFVLLVHFFGKLVDEVAKKK